ncbi:4-hydroxy-3-methylbut-2-enyl diphosphate reductase [Alloprevotella sp. OH1205_COT-284]|uniref:4-hydroxy-3-methylbut-2-enyl diphosphate reductase n=1 Tax=Alloprevotella sp. OH1205_COT-284 TaxID=2491043 RepID=UPI000F5DD2FE|nr:4-hydroxy-3-methylbut-2-enyl diphosphate reductase [Alloprevotella sp. OH1205_COT-284]RRD79906.1 4-hydroxy-3-methylbut-2-enyl diphosphate reductase [Alloprevotella sp. OH1205_COT-284]
MLNIEIDEGSGFCFGVTTAIRKAEEELASREPLACLGDIVHNGRECDRLRERGLKTIDHETFRHLKNTRVLLRAHGEPPSTYALAKRNNITLIDATCPVVLNLQRRIKKVYDEKENPQIVIYGKHGHAEVLGLVGQTNGEAIVVSDIEEIDKIDLTRNTYLFSQTTKPLEGFQALIDYLRTHIQPPAEFHYFDTICRSVSNRLPGVQAFARRHDVVLFVCGLKSSNGRVLFEACQQVNPNTHLVDDPAMLRPEWFATAESVGICGATSTPKWLMERCAEQVRAFELSGKG